MVVRQVNDEPRPGRDESVAVLYQRHYNELARLAYGLLGDRGAADEVVQDAFAVLLSRWSSLRDADAADGYLRAAVINGARSRWRRRRVRERAFATSQRDPAMQVDNVVEQSVVLAAVRQLPMRKRACVLLRFYADLSEAETASVLGVSVGTVKSQTSKALDQLAGLLAPNESEVGHERF